MKKQKAESLSSTSVRSTHEQVSRFWLHGILGALFISNAGTALQLATQAWFVWEVSHRAATVGVLGLVQATPLLGVPFVGGMLADRFPRQRLLLVTQGALALIAALMGSLALAGLLSLPLTLILSGVLASVSALDNPIRQVYVPSVVETSQRGRMVGLNSLTYNAGAVVGPAAAGVLLPLVGVSWCFLLNALSYLVVMAWLLAGPAAPPRPTQARDEQTLKVSRYIWNTTSLRTMLVLVAVISLLGRSYPTVLPIVVSRTWGRGVQTYGMVAALPGLGAALASIVAIWLLGHRKRRIPIWLGGVLLGGAVACVGMAGNLIVGGLALFATGGFATGAMTLLNASVQQTAPDEVRGRVMSLYTWLAAGMPALGGWLLGTVMGSFSSQSTLVTGGITLIVVTLIAGLGTGRNARSATRETSQQHTQPM